MKLLYPRFELLPSGGFIISIGFMHKQCQYHDQLVLVLEMFYREYRKNNPLTQEQIEVITSALLYCLLQQHDCCGGSRKAFRALIDVYVKYGERFRPRN